MVPSWKRCASGMARMDRSIISGLVETFGVQGAAEKIQQRCVKDLSADAEQFFRAHWKELRHDTIFIWLTLRAPDESGLRSTGEVVPRLIPFLVEKAATDPCSSLNLPPWIGNLADGWVRDEVIDGLHGRVSHELWVRLLPHAEGCTLFKALAGFEIQDHRPPAGVVQEGQPLRPLGSNLFAHRREEQTCADLLRKMVTDPAIRTHVLWVLREIKQLKSIIAPELVLDGLPTGKEVGFDGIAAIKFQLGIANELADAPTFKGVVTRRILGASQRGVPWGYLWWEIPEVLRDDIGLASIDTEKPAPWALASAARCLTGMEAWVKRLALAERPEPDLEEHVHFHHAAALWAGQPFPKKVEGEEEFFPQLDTAWLLSGPLPEDADEAFEVRLEGALRRFYHYDERIIWNRLAELPITPNRAKRIVESTLTLGIFYDLDRCDEIAEACGPIQGPVPRPKRWDAKVLRAHARLVGDEDCIAKWFDESIAAGDFWTALHLAIHDEPAVKPTRVEALKGILPRGDFRTLLRLREDHPWLLSESDVCSAVAAGQHPDDQWSWLGKNLPSYFLPVVEAKAASTPNAELATALLESLTKTSVPGRRLAEIALERVRTLGPSAMSPHQFGKLLSSGKLWEDPGAAVVEHVLNQLGPDGIRWLYQVAFESCRLTPNVVRVVHAVTAEALIDLARRGLEKGDIGSARRGLMALASLTAAPRLFRKVRALRELPGASSLSVLLDANEGLMRKSDEEQATLHTLLDALMTLNSTEMGGES